MSTITDTKLWCFTRRIKKKNQVKWELYKSKRNEVKKLLRQSEAAYWKQEFMNSKDPKQFWKLINKVLRKSKDSTIGPIITDSKDVLTSDLVSFLL